MKKNNDNIKRAIKKYISKDIFDNNDCLFKGRFIYPLSVKNLYENLEGEGHSTRVEDYINYENYRGVMQVVSEIKDIIRNQPLNPHTDYKPLKYYVKSSSIVSQFDNIFDDLSDLFNSRILYIGNKGSGKTLAENCWLHENNKKIEDNNVFWVRCDAAKLYRIWTDSKFIDTSLSELVSIEKYFSAQLLYVFIKYLDSSDLFQKIYKEIKSGNKMYSYRRSRKNDEIIKDYIINGIEKAKEKIRAEEGKKKNYSYAVFLMEQSQKNNNIYKYSWEKWINLSEAIERFLLENNYKIFKIIDGVDNIELYSDRSFKYFKKMIEEVSTKIVYKPQKGIVYLIAIRPETYGYIRSINNIISTESYEFASHPKKIIHEAPDINEVSKKRLDYLMALIMENNYFIKASWRVDAELFMVIVKKTFGKTFSSDKVLASYNYNIRQYLHNQLSLAQQIYYRVIQIGAKVVDIDKTFDVIYGLFSKRNKILDGRLFLNSQTEEVSNIYQGKYMFNPFYFNPEKYYFEVCENGGHWPGLCALRIVQVLDNTLYSSSDSMQSFLSREFRYKIYHIRQCLFMLESYGIISVDSDNTLSSFIYKLTEKGRTIYKYIFSDFDILYHLALDTPLPEKLFTDECVLSHSNKINSSGVLSKYNSSSIVTTYYFIKYLLSVDKYERDELMLSSQIKEKFKLPLLSKYCYYPVLKRAFILYMMADVEEKEIVKRKVLGIFKK